MQEKKVGVYDAKTQLSKMIDRVAETGEGFTITVHGKAVVDVVPAQPARQRTRKQVLEKLLRYGGVGVTISREEIRSAIEEGRM